LVTLRAATKPKQQACKNKRDFLNFPGIIIHFNTILSHIPASLTGNNVKLTDIKNVYYDSLYGIRDR